MYCNRRVYDRPGESSERCGRGCALDSGVNARTCGRRERVIEAHCEPRARVSLNVCISIWFRVGVSTRSSISSSVAVAGELLGGEREEALEKAEEHMRTDPMMSSL